MQSHYAISMKITNQVFLQLREANRFALAKNPLQRRLAVILLDNIIEVQLRRKARRALNHDQTTWYWGRRKHNKKVRYGVSRYYKNLLDFAADKEWIDERDISLLTYAHAVRNSFYHDGDYNSLDAELAIRLMYHFVETRFPVWRGSGSIIQISPYDPIPIEDAMDDASGFCPLTLNAKIGFRRGLDAANDVESEAYWKDALNDLLTYRPSDDIRQLICQKVNEYLEEIERHKQFIADSKGVDFRGVLVHRFGVHTPWFSKDLLDGGKNIHALGALNIYLAVLKDEESLLDVADPIERANAFHKRLEGHKFIRNPISRQKLTALRYKAKKILDMTHAEGIALFLKTEQELATIAAVLRELAWDLEGYYQHMSDLYRGK